MVTSTLASSASQGASQISSSLSSSLSSALSGFGSVGTPVAMVGLASALVEVAGVAASAAQSLWLLPAAVGAVAAGIGTLKIATDGFGDALKNIRDPEKFAAALQGLAPNAQQAALAIQAILPAFDQLKSATQNALFAGVAQQLNTLANTYLPSIQQMTTGIAGAFNQMFQGVANQLMTPETQAALQTFIANITQAFQNLAPAAAPFTKALADIASVGSQFLPGLATSIANAAQSFSQFITQAAQSGQLKQWLGEGLNTVKQLAQGAWMLAQGFMQLAPIAQAVLPDILRIISGISDAMPVIGKAALLMGPNFGAWEFAITQVKNVVDVLGTAFNAVKGIVESIWGPISAVLNNIRTAIEAVLAPIRAAAGLVGINIPDLPTVPTSITSAPGSPTLPTPGPGQPILGGGAGAQRERRGAAPLPAATAGIAPVPAAGYPVPVVAPKSVAPAGPPPVAVPQASSYAPAAYTAPPAGYTSDAALLANVPAGRYTQTQGADLTKGLADCSSAVEDLVNLMQGNSTAGRSMSTSNEAQWLTQHGFVQGMGGPGDFRVGFNSGHTQATLPGGTPFNWGSNAAAANRGIGGTGADDPAFTSHFYKPVSATQTPGVTAPTGSSTDPYYMQYPEGYKPPGPDMQQFGQQMGSDIWSSILPDGFKNPTQFGSMKLLSGLFSGLTGIKLPSGSVQGGDGAALGGGGGGGISGLLGGLTGILPQPFTPQPRSPGSAPGEFMPLMPSAADAAISPFGVTGQGGAAGPGNQVNNSININNPVGQDHLTHMVNTATQAQVPRVRQGIRPLP